MPARLPDNVIYRIQLRLECGETPKAIYEATKVLLSTIYLLQSQAKAADPACD